MINKITLFIFVAASLLASNGAIANGVGGGGGGDRPGRIEMAELSSNEACEMGPYVYLMEQVPGASRPISRKVLYICVDGVYRRNGVVPRYSRCIDGESRMNPETVPWGNHSREIKVRYTCIKGRFRRNP